MTKETYNPQYPFEYKGEQFDALEIRRPKMRDLKRFDTLADPMTKGLAMLSDLAETAPGVVDEMDPIDFNEAPVVIASFLGVPKAETQKISNQ